MKKTALFISISILFTLQSCTNLALKAIGVTETDSEYYMMSNGNKTFAYIPMHHIGTESFYNSVAHDVDSFQKLGYKVYYEGVGKADLDSTETIIYKKKLRKLIGLNIEQYYDTTTKMIGGMIKYKGKLKLMNQPSYPQLKVNMDNAENIDVPVHKLIQAYEDAHGEIILDECDLNTELNTTYSCSGQKMSSSRKFLNQFVIEMRDQNLFNAIIEEQHDKILIIYGKKHFSGIKKKLIAHDPAWKVIK